MTNRTEFSMLFLSIVMYKNKMITQRGEDQSKNFLDGNIKLKHLASTW